jgi:hypothetical protein
VQCPVAQRRCDERATAAIRLLQSEEVEINFRSVAARAQVSTAWVYRTIALRAAIMKARHTSRQSPAKTCSIVSGSRTERVVATRALSDQLEAAYGRVAVEQPKICHCNNRQE